VKVTNKGASAQPIDIAMSGDFTESDNCGGSVAAAGSCTANISFAPTAIGAISGAASIYDNSNNLLALIALKGTGDAPVTVVPASLSFTGGTVGTLSAAQTVKITNATAGAVTVTAVTASGDFVINTGTCLTTPLASAGSCTVSVQVQPTAAKVDGAIVITDNARGSLPLIVKLSSAATGGPTTPISLTKSSLTFKAAAGGTSATQTVTVTNKSASAVAIGTITASSDYTIVDNTCPASLAVKGTCKFQIAFNPTFVGTIEGSAAVAYTGNNSPQLVNLTGTAEAPLTVTPAKLTFTSQTAGTISAAQAITIANNSASAVALDGVVPSGDFEIQASGTTCSFTGGTLAASSSCVIEIQFAPVAKGAIAGALTVTDTASPNPLLVALSGTATAAPACPNNSLLKGNYAMLLNGWSSAKTASSAVGSFLADGNGNITNGLSDGADQGNSAPGTATFTGTYCVGSNNLASIALTDTGSSHQSIFEAALDASDGNGHIIRYDTSGKLIAGLLRKQTTSAFSTGAITGNYAFGTVGVDNAGGRIATAGALTANGSGSFSGESDVDDAGTVLAEQTFSSTDFNVASTGRGTATITSSDGNVNYVFYVVSSSELLMMAADTSTPPMILAGQVLKQSGTFTNASMNGVSVIESECLDTVYGAVATVGVLTSSGAEGTWTFTGDANHWGTVETETASGAFSVASNGRMMWGASGSENPVFYLVGPNQAFYIGTNNAVEFGSLTPQTGSDFTNASLSGLYVGGSQQPESWNVSQHVASLQADGNDNVTGTDDRNNMNGPTTESVSTTYAVSSYGRVVAPASGPPTGIIYMISPSQFVFLDATSSNPGVQDFHQ
jgi:hypothetical protein